jgi:hypothetical protein
MKRFLLVLAVGCIFAGCHSKLDLDNLDSSAEVKMGLTLPVGSMQLNLMDLLGDVDNLYIDSSNTTKNGVLTMKLDTSVSRYFHQIDLAQYMSDTTINLNVADKILDNDELKTLLSLMGGSITTPKEFKFHWDFPFTINLKGINDPDKVQSERLDSALIEMASFASTIQGIDLPVEWGWVDSIRLNLGDQVNRENKVMTVYRKGDAKYSQYNSYGKKIPTDIDNFTLNMLDSVTGKPLEECTFTIYIDITIPAGKPITLLPTAAFSYKLDIQFIDYKAIWGMFDPSSAMSESSVIDLSGSWNKASFLTKSKIPFADPRIDCDIVTQIAGPLMIKKAQVYVISDDYPNGKYAKWGDNNFKDITFASGEWIDPTDNSTIGQWTEKMKFWFDNSDEHGHLDSLFTVIPKKLGYNFAVDFDKNSDINQMRITNNTSIRVNAKCTLPMIFNQGVQITYPDTMPDVSISQYSIDSIQAESDVIDTISAAQVKLVMKATSMIPLGLKLVMRCLDENGNLVMDPKVPSEPFNLFESDTILITPPDIVYSSQAGGNLLTPRVSTFIASLDKEDLNVFTKIKKIAYTAILDDDALKEAYKSGMNNVRLTKDDYVTIKIGLAANVEGVLNFGKNDEKK